jgi:hypothetical protein
MSLFTVQIKAEKRVVPPVMVLWIIGLALSRWTAFFSGVGSVTIKWWYSGSVDATQSFFTMGQLFNVVVLSDFVYYYATSRGKGRGALELELPM